MAHHLQAERVFARSKIYYLLVLHICSKRASQLDHPDPQYHIDYFYFLQYLLGLLVTILIVYLNPVGFGVGQVMFLHHLLILSLILQILLSISTVYIIKMIIDKG